jgi:type II secretory pathway pseudopilin PulG
MIRRLVPGWPSNRRQAQSGATLIELLVSVVIMGLALTLVIGTFSTGLLQATLAKRNTAAVAVVQYEVDQIGGAQYGALPGQYSDCFATESAISPPTPAASYLGGCPSSAYTLRVDVSAAPGPRPSTQLWSITVASLPSAARIGSQVQIVKDNR